MLNFETSMCSTAQVEIDYLLLGERSGFFEEVYKGRLVERSDAGGACERACRIEAHPR